MRTGHRVASPPASRGTQTSGSLPWWWGGLVAFAFLTGANPFVAVLLMAGMAPALVSWLTCSADHRYCTHSIAYLGLAGVVPMAWSLWQAGATAASLARYLSDPLIWLVMYGPAGLGAVIYIIVPPLHEMLVTLNIERKTRSLQRRQRRLVEEWGPRVDPNHEEAPASDQGPPTAPST